jgi:aconitate hydratase
MRSASTSSAMAAPPASAIPARCRRRFRRPCINDNDLVAASVLSGNRNFEGRVNPDVKANYLASPPLVVAYAIAGSMQKDLAKDPIGFVQGRQAGLPQGHLADQQGDRRDRAQARHQEMFQGRYSDVFKGDANWQGSTSKAARPMRGTHLHLCAEPALFRRPDHGRRRPVTDVDEARIGLWRCSSTRSRPTTSLRPVRSRRPRPPASTSVERQVAPRDFNSYGARRGNHEVMMRGTFANIRIKNQMVPGVEGG